MITSSLLANQLSPEASEWFLGSYLDALDRLDLDRYASFLAENVELRFNNEPPVWGKAAAVEMLGRYWRGFRSIEHEPLNIYGDDRAFMLEALNHYVRLDGEPVTVRAVAMTDRDAAGLVTSVRTYADASAVFAA